MTIFIITEFSSYNTDVNEVVAVCDSYASAIQWMIENKGLTKDYSQLHPIYYHYWTLEDFYGENWLKTMVEQQDMKLFHLDGLNYEIEEKEVFSKKPLDI
jgi:hypothetical protein